MTRCHRKERLRHTGREEQAMPVLVAVASRHGSTREIAEWIGGTLESKGLDVHVRDVEEVERLEPYDAVVLGGALYMGRWLEEGRSFARQHAAELATRPTWLFSSGPIGSPPKPDPTSAAGIGDDVEHELGAREHRVFGGRLDRACLGLAERAVTKVVHAPEGDFRDRDEIAAWAGGIADTLSGARDGSRNA
jgi:menaquinone-dependent protoporphyrinogen oxidase